MSKRIVVQIAERQRYPTPGDWIPLGRHGLRVLVSPMSDTRFENLIAVHEIVEGLLCRHAKIDDEDVVAFDQTFERCRKDRTKMPCGCIPLHDEEAGNHEHAPYAEQHERAAKVEEMLAEWLDLDEADWAKYTADCEAAITHELALGASGATK